MLRSSLLAALLLLACDNTDAFYCSTAHAYDTNGPRECIRSSKRCKSYGNGGTCFERATAFCFETGYGDQSLNIPDMPKRQIVCTPTAEECKTWQEAHKPFPNRNPGECQMRTPEEVPPDGVAVR